MKGVLVRLSVATPYRRSRNPDTSSAPKPRLPPLTRATFLLWGMVVLSSRLTNLRPGIGAGTTPYRCLVARFLETRTVMILHDHLDDGGHFVALEPRMTEPADSQLERVWVLRRERGDLGRDDLAGDRVGMSAYRHVLDV